MCVERSVVSGLNLSHGQGAQTLGQSSRKEQSRCRVIGAKPSQGYTMGNLEPATGVLLRDLPAVPLATPKESRPDRQLNSMSFIDWVACILLSCLSLMESALRTASLGRATSADMPDSDRLTALGGTVTGLRGGDMSPRGGDMRPLSTGDGDGSREAEFEAGALTGCGRSSFTTEGTDNLARDGAGLGGLITAGPPSSDMVLKLSGRDLVLEKLGLLRLMALGGLNTACRWFEPSFERGWGGGGRGGGMRSRDQVGDNWSVSQGGVLVQILEKPVQRQGVVRFPGGHQTATGP